MTTAAPLDAILDALTAHGHKIRHSGGQIMTRCPVHADEHESLALSLGDDGRALVHCHAGCEPAAICEAVGMTLSDLFPPNANGSPQARANGSPCSERIYEILDVAGTLIARHHRRDHAAAGKEKDMWWSRPGTAKGLGGLKVRDIPLYGTELLSDAARADHAVIIVEGETSADALRAWGLVALATVTGASKTPAAAQLEPLRGREVLLWPDNDPAGARHMAELAIKLRPIAASVRVITWTTAPPRGDAADFRGDLDEIRALLEGAAEPAVALPGVSAAGGHVIESADVEILDPKRTLPTAERFVATHYSHPEGRTIHTYAGAVWTWRGNRYVLTEDAAIRAQLQPWLHAAACQKETKHGPKLEPFPAHGRTLGDALTAIRDLTHLPSTIAMLAWLGPGEPPAPLHELLPCRSTTLHIPTGHTIKSTPKLFNTSALDFDYDADAPEPFRWLAFLDELFGADGESIELLRNWFGYCLTADTRQQKALLLVGPKRSGKGTIARVLTRLVGVTNVCSPTTSSLAGSFGLQPLIGKTLAIISDARFSSENVGTVIERLLSIIGEDSISVDRKFLGAVTLTLPTRFAVLTNELPRFNDSSAALAGRFLVLRLTDTFYGREDPNLTSELLVELPGILRWAVEGWERLQERGRFQVPQSSEDAVRDLEDLSSPVNAFVRDRCIVGPGHQVLVQALYAAWQSWCNLDGRQHPTTRQTFGRDLAAALPGVRRREGVGRQFFYHGIDIR